jgi:hypothetical protein
MSDHHHDHAPVDGPWAGGWLVAAGAGVLSALIARAIGDVSMTPAVLVGLVSFGVFGVLLGSGGVERAEFDAHGGHESGGHGHAHH